MSWQTRIDAAISARKQAAAFRVRQPNRGGSARFLTQGDLRYLNFSGNDYLGLSQDAAVIAAWQQGAQKYGVGSGGSGHVTGYSMHLRLRSTAAWGDSAALLLSRLADHSILAALMQSEDRVLAIKSATRLCGALRTNRRSCGRFIQSADSLRAAEKQVTRETLIVTKRIRMR